MIKKIFTTLTSTCLAVFVASISLFSHITPSLATQINPESNVDNSIGNEIKKSSDNLEGSKIAAVPDLGDDQAFPFIPGFGKNSGKD